MRRSVVLLCSLLLLVGLAPAPATAVPAAPVVPAKPAAGRPTDPVAHDPTMVRQGGWYYVAITGDAGRANTYLPMKRSRDLVHWEEIGPVFTALPSWILPALGLPTADAPKDLWAPDLSYSHGEWRLYYAISQFGRNNSVIGLATTKSLDPGSKKHRWVDRGPVLQSKPATTPDPQEFNAIDPDVTVDAGGRTWLSFGSFWTGIKMRRLDARTGLLSTTDTRLYDLATRPTPPDAVEGPSIIRHGRYYYLFVAFDYCCRGVDSDYRVVVGRSRTITGPYVDRSGVPMLRGGGTEVLRGYNEFAGTGHPDVYATGGTDYLVNHYYDATDTGTPRLNVRTLDWDGGWPAVSDPLNPSRSVGHGSAYVRIVPRSAAAVVEDQGCGYEGAPLALGEETGSRCQQWQVDDRGSGSRILNRYSNRVAEVAACDNRDGGAVAQWGWLGFLADNDCQRWSFAPARDGWTTVTSVLDGHRVWTVGGDHRSLGSPVQVSAAVASSAAQDFRFDPVGRVLLASPTAPTMTLGVSGCRSGDVQGTRTSEQARSTRRCQEWVFDAVPGSTAAYTITNARTHTQLATAGCSGRRPPAGSLSLVRPGASNAGCRTWSLVPTDLGTWRLSSGSTVTEVRLALP